MTAQLAASASSGVPFTVHLRGTGTFRPVSPVVFVALAEGISGTEQLASTLRSGALDVPLAFPFHPHVTIAHHVSEAAMDRAEDQLAGFRLRFTVGAFQLYEQDDDGVWHQIETYPLSAGDNLRQ